MHATPEEIVGQPVIKEFTQQIERAGRGVFLLDYDGTLAPFAFSTSEVRPYPGVTQVLDAMLETGRARLVIVTGRYLKDAIPHLPTRTRLEMWGSHGRERLLPDGHYSVLGITDQAVAALTLADSWSAGIESLGGRCEAKPGAFAIHWRGATTPQVEAIRKLVTAGFRNDHCDGVLEVHDFDGGIEFRAPGRDKGDVVRAILAETEPQVPVAYIGDDFTDEDAFVALRGRGLGVLVRPERRSSAAACWIRPPGELLQLLDLWLQALGGSRAI